MEIGRPLTTMMALLKDAPSVFFSPALSYMNFFPSSMMNSELEQKSIEKNGDLGNDGRGSVSDILTYMDDGQVVIPYVDLCFFLDCIHQGRVQSGNEMSSTIFCLARQ
eukprot:scaffold214517_cov24-Attheya_sp.AAC.1